MMACRVGQAAAVQQQQCVGGSGSLSALVESNLRKNNKTLISNDLTIYIHHITFTNTQTELHRESCNEYTQIFRDFFFRCNSF